MEGNPATSRLQPQDEGPRLIWDPEPWGRSFRGNLSELLFPSGDRAIKHKGWATGDWFWRDVFVRSPLPRRGLLDSYLAHIFVVVALIGLNNAGWFQPRAVQQRNPFENTHIEYYSTSEFLPPVDTDTPAPKPAPEQRKARTNAPAAPPDPVFAKQEIISVPPNPDNLSQTIVTPQLPKLDRHVDLPNIVSNMPTLAPQPIVVPKSAARQKVSDTQAPKLNANAAAPKLDARAQLPRLQPAANANTTSAALPDSLPVPALKANDTPVLEAPAPVPQKAAQAGGEEASAMPSVTSNNAAQIIALSTRPVDPRGSLDVPKGNRLGSFEAGPTGRPDASGSPATSPAAGGPGGGNGRGGTGDGKSGLPPGIKVGPAPGPTPSGTVVAAPSTSKPPAADPATREKFMAALRNPMATPPKQSVGQPEREENIEDKKLANSVFGGKRYYTLTFNAPNLNSATGSWVIRFAELRPLPGQSGELSGPAPLSKADPAYPPELVHDRVEGTVVLYAVIHADGSLSDVKVLRSVHEQLDENAVKALKRWRFQPGMKNGKPVDLEMTVQVPFKARRTFY